jgi:hypothetical protein
VDGRTLAGLAAAFALLAGAAACSAGGGTGNGAASRSAADSPGQAPARSAPTSGAAAAAAPAAKSPASAATTAQAAPALLDTSRARIRTARLGLTAARVADTATAATTLVERAGGEVDGDDRSGSGSRATADLLLRVPPAGFTATLSALAGLTGAREVSRQVTVQDVTQNVVDVDTRVANQRASITRIRTLLGGATKLGDIITVEDELTRREADLESLEARQRALVGEVATATISLHIAAVAPKPAAKPRPAAQRGFLAGLAAGWHAFNRALQGGLTVLGALLPFLLLAVPILAAVGYARRRRAPTTTTGPAPTP